MTGSLLTTNLKRIASFDGTILSLKEYTRSSMLSQNTNPTQTTRILFSHATGFHGRVFDKTINGLMKGEGQSNSTNLRCYSFDHRGHGLSGWNYQSRITWDIIGRDVTAVSSHLEVESKINHDSSPLVGVGHSMGAVALILDAIRYPHRYQALVLYEPVILPPKWTASDDPNSWGKFDVNNETNLSRAARKRRREYSSFNQALANFKLKPPMNSLHDDVLHSYVEHGFFVAPIDNQRVDPSESMDSIPLGDNSLPSGFTLRLRCDPNNEADIYNRFMEDKSWGNLKNLKVPVWFVAGKYFDFQPSAMAEPMVREIPTHHFQRWDDCGHFGPLEKPDKWTQLIQTVTSSL